MNSSFHLTSFDVNFMQINSSSLLFLLIFFLTFHMGQYPQIYQGYQNINLFKIKKELLHSGLYSFAVNKSSQSFQGLVSFSMVGNSDQISRLNLLDRTRDILFYILGISRVYRSMTSGQNQQVPGLGLAKCKDKLNGTNRNKNNSVLLNICRFYYGKILFNNNQEVLIL